MAVHELDPEQYYRKLDAIMTRIMERGGLEITPEVDELLVLYNWTLRLALGLSNHTH